MAQTLVEPDQLNSSSSSGAGIFCPAGACLPYAGSTEPNGFVFCDGTTYDSVANPEFAALFAAIGIVYGGSGAADFDVPDIQGNVVVGIGAGSFTGLNDKTGSETHTLDITEIPSHDHSGTTNTTGDHNHSGSTATSAGTAHTHGAGSLSTDTEANHSHSIPVLNSTSDGSGDNTFANAGGGNTGDAGSHSHSITGTTASGGSHTHALTITTDGDHSHTISAQGGGGSHNNIQPSIGLNYIISLGQ